MRTSWIASMSLVSLVAFGFACGGSDDDVTFARGAAGAQAGDGDGDGAGAGDPVDEGGEQSAEGRTGGNGGNGAKSGAGGKGGSASKGGSSPGEAGNGGSTSAGGSGGKGAASGKGGSGGSAGSAEGTVTACGDNVDNDGDGFVDCRDNDCRALLPSCREDTPAACSDGLDNDADGHADCDDFDCQQDGASAGCTSTATCTDDHEPDDALGAETKIQVLEDDGPSCSEDHTTCAGDLDRFRVRFEATSSGGTLDLRLRVFSQGDGAPVVVTMTDPTGKAAAVTKSLSKAPETLKLLYDTAIVCGGSCEGPVVRELSVTHKGSGKLFYRVCGEIL